MIRRRALVAAACATLLLGGAGGVHAMRVPASALDDGGSVSPARRFKPWWEGFNDATLSGLIDAAHRRAASASSPLNAVPLEIGVAAAYISIRVNSLVLVYLGNERAAMARQLQLMIASRPEHDDFIRELRLHLKDADDAIRKVQAQRDMDAELLAGLGGMSKSALVDAMGDMRAEELRSLPRFSFPVPRALPMTSLINRSDINLAAALYGIDPVESLDGVIGASGRDQAAESGKAQGQHPLYFGAVEQARGEVSSALRRLQLQNDQVNAVYRQVLGARARFEASASRRDRGEGSEVMLMEDFRSMLRCLHVLAVADGKLALAWITLIASLGSTTAIEPGT